MLQNRQQKPISPEQLFSRLLNQSYRQSQCEDQSSKLKKQRLVLIELIQEYSMSIQSELLRNDQHHHLERIKMQKLEEIDRLKRQRILIQQSVNDELARIAVSEGEQAQKEGLIIELQQIHSVNQKIRLKIRDMLAYVQRLEQCNAQLQSKRTTVHLKTAKQLKVNPSDWRQRIDTLHKSHESHENQLRAKMLQKQTQRIKQVRRQQEQIWRRNSQRWQSFRKLASRPTINPSTTSIVQNILPFFNRKTTNSQGKSFRVI